MMKQTFKYFSLLALLVITNQAFGQQTVSGTITDKETNEALIGANVLIVGTTEGTTTDVNGVYTLKLPASAEELLISYTGYGAVQVSIEGRKTIDVSMTSGELLDEVLVIGYGTIKKSDATGAIETIEVESKDVQQFDNFQDFMQGRASGVYIQSNGSELGSPNSIRIRGANSLRGDNEPLYVIDGIIVNSSTEDTSDPLSGGSSFLSSQNGLTGINPQDIESIEVLKDASATAIYGSRGANGVILITTKKGARKDGQPAKFDYRASTRIGKATRLYPVLSTDQYIDYQNEERAIDGFLPTYYRYEDGKVARFEESEEFMLANKDSLDAIRGVDWYEDILQNSVAQSHRLSVSGGNKTSDFYVAGGYNEGKGIIPNTRIRSGDFIMKYNTELTDRLTINPRLSASFTNNNASKGTENLGNSNTSLIRQVTQGAPLFDLIDNSGNDIDLEDAVDGPRGWIEDYNDDSQEVRALAAFQADYRISDVWTYRVLAGADYRSKTRKLWYGNSLNRGRLANGEAGISTLDRTRFNIDNTLLFNKEFDKHNKLNGTVGIVYDALSFEKTSFSATDFANQELRYDGISFGQNFTPLRVDNAKEAIQSYLGRANYTFKNKYLLTFSFRADGASKFAEGNKYSFFPSAAIAWKMNKEKFLKDSEVISNLKMRVGVGRTGSQAINPYQTYSRYGLTNNLLSDGQGGSSSAIIPLNLGNRNLIWETTDQVNAGIDFGFMEDRFVGNVDVYYKITRDLLQQLSIGPSAGFNNIVTNQGDLENKGIELGLVAHVLEGKLKWTVSGNISFNRNRILNLGLPAAQFGTETYSAYLGANVSGGTGFKAPANIFIEGQPAALFWGYATDGIISNETDLANAANYQGRPSQLGDILYIDQNNDGLINSSDLTVIGDPNPDFVYGIGSDLSYKAFSLDLFMNGVYGNDIANGNLAREGIALANTNNIRTEAYLDAWREDNPDGAYPRIGYNLNGDFTDRLVEDASFLRLTYVSLGYQVPVSSNDKISNFRVFVTGHNLLLLTDYSGFDPEVDSFSFDPSRRGIDWNSFPNQKAVSIGLNITF